MVKKKRPAKQNPVTRAVSTGEHGPRPSQQVHRNEKDYNRREARRIPPPEEDPP